jgi:hypothetical protein
MSLANGAENIFDVIDLSKDRQRKKIVNKITEKNSVTERSMLSIIKEARSI